MSRDGFISLKELNSTGEKELSISFPTGSLKVTYDQSEYTPELERQMQKKVEGGMPGAMLSTLLMSIMRSWNVENTEEVVLKGRPGYFQKDESGEYMLDSSGKKTPETELVIPPGIPLPLTERVLDQVIGIFAQSKMAKAIMDDNRPNEEASTEPKDSW